jgi:glycogen debranching enzyme
MDDLSFYAMGLDGAKRQIDAVTSNPGHLLWSGVVPPERIGPVADRLMGPAMNSGWGIRTFAAGQPGYDPGGYHTGTVWPHDNAIIAAGLRRAGRHAEADRLTAQVLEAARLSPGDRLPELFRGDDRASAGAPPPYPVACSPQAWAAAAPLLLVQAMLGLRAEAADGTLDASRAHLPEWLGSVAVAGLRLGEDRLGVVVRRDRRSWIRAEITGSDGLPRPRTRGRRDDAAG